jgi:hypothetical protein
MVYLFSIQKHLEYCKGHPCTFVAGIFPRDSWKRDLSGLKGTSHLWTNTVTNCLGQIPRTYSRQWIDMEGIRKIW